jgi:TatD DNase family protein
MEMQFVDTHAHIYADEFKSDIDEVLEKCLDHGVKKIYMPNIDHTSIDGMMELEEKYLGRCVAMMGLHPCYVKKGFEKELYVVEEWLGKRSFAAVGEIGIDLYWDKSFFGQQQEAFRIQLGWAKQYGLPVVIHCRDSFEETISIVEELNDDQLSGVFHCFSGNIEEANRAIAAGFHIGIGGVATFKNGGLDKVIPHVDIRHIVLETDSPYLAPVPHRGKRNEPAYLPKIAQRVAQLLDISIQEVAEKTTHNAEVLFKGR